MQEISQIGEDNFPLRGFCIPQIECCRFHAGMLTAHQCLIRPRCHLHGRALVCEEVGGTLPHTEAFTFLDPLELQIDARQHIQDGLVLHRQLRCLR